MRHFPSLTLIVIILAVKCEAAEDGDGVVQGPAVPSYNESLRLVTEAREDVNNVTRTINLVSEDMARSVERQNEVSDYLETHEGLTGDVHIVQAVSVWVSWLMANSLCHGDLNMTGADSLWRHSGSLNTSDPLIPQQ